MSCKIQMPPKAQQNLRLAGKHGKFRVQTICNDVPEDEIKFDATSGDIKLKLNCKEPEEYDDDGFIVDEKDLLAEIEKLKTKMEELEMEVETLKEKHELDIDTINKELVDLKTEVKTLRQTHELETDAINKELEELNEMFNRY